MSIRTSMSFFTSRLLLLPITLLAGMWLAVGCSSSNDSQPSLDSEATNTDDQNIINDGIVNDDTDTSSVPDPLVQNSTLVTFDITVPQYQSDALQVSLFWGEKTITASWVGDENWTARDEFPTDTENLLTVNFYDRNGDITLGSVETQFKTGTNSSESYQITSNQFNTNKWDNDGDGTSNINELISGTFDAGALRILLFSETRGFRHPSIPTALDTLDTLATSIGISTDRANDSTNVFTDDNLANYDAVVWALTSGDVLSTEEQEVFERYIRAGGGYAGIHAASDTEYDWPWYGNLVGAYFDRHPEIQTARQIVEDATHPSTAHLGSDWLRTDEWYDFQSNPRSQVNVLLRLDETSYSGGSMGEDHPIAWYHEFNGGRSWYTGGGHTIDSYSESDFRAHLLGGLRYVTGLDSVQ